MLQRYIHALAHPSLIIKTYRTVPAFLGDVAGNYPFLVIALRNVNKHFWRCCRGLTPPSGDAKKCQQTFLAPLLGMALGVKKIFTNA